VDAATDPVAGLDHDDLEAAVGEAAGSRGAGDARADDGDPLTRLRDVGDGVGDLEAAGPGAGDRAGRDRGRRLAREEDAVAERLAERLAGARAGVGREVAGGAEGVGVAGPVAAMMDPPWASVVARS
jgi:hypothetical protein